MIEVLIRLWAIKLYLKDIHYKAKGKNFWSDHIFADELDLDGDIDAINEVLFLGHNMDAPAQYDVLRDAIAILPEQADIDSMFKNLAELLQNAMGIMQEACSKQDNLVGDDNLLGGIAEKLQKFNGLVVRRIKK